MVRVRARLMVGDRDRVRVRIWVRGRSFDAWISFWAFSLWALTLL